MFLCHHLKESPKIHFDFQMGLTLPDILIMESLLGFKMLQNRIALWKLSDDDDENMITER